MTIGIDVTTEAQKLDDHDDLSTGSTYTLQNNGAGVLLYGEGANEPTRWHRIRPLGEATVTLNSSWVRMADRPGEIVLTEQ